MKALSHSGLDDLNAASSMTASTCLAAVGGDSGLFAAIAIALDEAGLSFRVDPVETVVHSESSTRALDLRERSFNALRSRGITTVGELCAASPTELLPTVNFGTKSLVDVYVRLEAHGLRLGATPAEPTEPVMEYSVTSGQNDLALRLAALASVLVHASPQATLRDLLELLPDEVLNRPAGSMLTGPPEATSLKTRIDEFLNGLTGNRRTVAEGRSGVGDRRTLEEIGSELGVTREWVRQLENDIGRDLADDPLVALLIARLRSLSPATLEERFRNAGFGFDRDTGMVLLAARATGALDNRSEISAYSAGDLRIVSIGSPSTRFDHNTFLKSILQLPEHRQGSVSRLETAIGEALLARGDFEPTVLAEGGIHSELLAVAPIWLDGRGGYVATCLSRQDAVEARLLMTEGATLEELEAFYDEAFPAEPGGPSLSHDRRVTSLLFRNTDAVQIRPGVWSHRLLGAAPKRPLVERMEATFDELGVDTLALDELVRILQEADPTVRESTVRSYASAGLRFSSANGLVTRAAGRLTMSPVQAPSMFRDAEGRWTWQNTRDDDAMYRSSTHIPPALVAELQLEIGDDMSVAFPCGEVVVGSSGNTVYLPSRGGIRTVLDAAGIRDGDRYRIVVTGQRSASCERMDPVDESSPRSIVATTIGVPIDNAALVAAAIRAVGLDPEASDPEAVAAAMGSRSKEFAKAFYATSEQEEEQGHAMPEPSEVSTFHTPPPPGDGPQPPGRTVMDMHLDEPIPEHTEHGKSIFDSPLSSDAPLIVTRRDTGATFGFDGRVPAWRQFGALVDSLWEGPDPVEVIGWRDITDSELGTVEIEATSPTHGRHFYVVRFRDSAFTDLGGIHQEMRSEGYEPGDRPTNMTHLLYNTLLEITEDYDFSEPPEAGFFIYSRHRIDSPWAPECSPWFGADRGDHQRTFGIDMRWEVLPVDFEEGESGEITEYLRSTILPLCEELPLELVYDPSDGDDPDEDPTIIEAAVAELVAEGWKITTESIPYGPAALIITLNVWLEFVSADDAGLDPEASEVDAATEVDDEAVAEDEGQDQKDDGSEEEAEFVTWWVTVPLPAADVEAVVAKMAAGLAPEDALFAVTGSRTFPQPTP
jgi:hypothetical protein